MNEGEDSGIPAEDMEKIRRSVEALDPTNRMDDRQMLLVAYGALRAVNDPRLDVVIGMVEAHLFLPGTEQ